MQSLIRRPHIIYIVDVDLDSIRMNFDLKENLCECDIRNYQKFV